MLTDERIEELCWTELDRRLLSFARAIEAEATKPQEPVAWRIETGYEQPYYMYSGTLPTRGEWDALYTIPQKCPKCADLESLVTVENQKRQQVEAERDALAMQVSEMRDVLLELTELEEDIKDGIFDSFTLQPARVALTLPDYAEIIKRHDAAVLRKAAEKFAHGFKFELDRMADELEKS